MLTPAEVIAVNFTQVFVVVDEPPPVSVELESSSFEQEIVKIVTNAKIVAFKKFVELYI